MYETCKKGYHQTDYRHRIVPVVGAAFFHSGKAEGIFKQRNHFCKTGKEIKQVAKPETKIAVEIKRQQRICGGKGYGQEDQRDFAVKVSFCLAKTGYGNQNQKITQHIRHKIQSEDGADDLIDYHFHRIGSFRCKRDKCWIGNGGF